MYTLNVDGFNVAAVEDLGSAADELYEISEVRKKWNRTEKELTGRMTYLKQYIFDHMPDENLTGVCGKKAIVSSVIKEFPAVSNWDLFYEHIIMNNRMDLMQKRLGARACMEELTEGCSIPGVEIKEVADLVVKKIR